MHKVKLWAATAHLQEWKHPGRAAATAEHREWLKPVLTSQGSTPPWRPATRVWECHPNSNKHFHWYLAPISSIHIYIWIKNTLYGYFYQFIQYSPLHPFSVLRFSEKLGMWTRGTKFKAVGSSVLWTPGGLLAREHSYGRNDCWLNTVSLSRMG